MIIFPRSPVTNNGLPPEHASESEEASFTEIETICETNKQINTFTKKCSSFTVCSHCGSDQLNRPDRQNAPTILDQLQSGLYTRLLPERYSTTHSHSCFIHDFNPTATPIFNGSSDPYLIIPILTPSLIRYILGPVDLCSICIGYVPIPKISAYT